MAGLEHEIRIDVPDAVAGRGEIAGDLRRPSGARGLVVFAHGSGSSRRSPRNRMVATSLIDAGFATLLFDLLTSAEERVDDRTREFRFDIGLLAERLLAAGDAVAERPDTAGLPLGAFGASTGAAAALVAAAARPTEVRAVVSRGGRPDLAGDALPGVRAPTLLIVGGRDPQVIDLNHEAAARMTCERETVIVPGATHLFEEPGTLEEVAHLALDWFDRYLPGS
jgi:putative phosphoribosyl transferase